MNHVRFGFLGCHHGGDIFQEIYAAFFACAAMPLFMLTRRTLVTQRGMAPPAEARDITCFGAAFGAIHSFILPGVPAIGPYASVRCAHRVNTVLQVRYAPWALAHPAEFIATDCYQDGP